MGLLSGRAGTAKNTSDPVGPWVKMRLNKIGGELERCNVSKELGFRNHGPIDKTFPSFGVMPEDPGIRCGVGETRLFHGSSDHRCDRPRTDGFDVKTKPGGKKFLADCDPHALLLDEQAFSRLARQQMLHVHVLNHAASRADSSQEGRLPRVKS
jgi:hypothetical protein